jgi:ribosomal protein S27E
MDLLEPLSFDQYAEAQTFVRDNACALCRGHLSIHPIDRRWYVRCHACGPVLSTTHAGKGTLAKIASDEHAARLELRMPGRPADKINLWKEGNQ